jgi:hypothetical protein
MQRLEAARRPALRYIGFRLDDHAQDAAGEITPTMEKI